MSDELELKLKCLALAGGDVERAREILNFVRSDEETGRLRSLQYWVSQPAVVAMSDMLELLRSGAGCIRPHESDLLVALKWAYTSGGGDESTITHLTPYGVEVAQKLFPESSTHPRWIPSTGAAPATEEESGDQSQPVAYITTQNGCMEVRDDGSVHEINSLVVEQTDDPVLSAFENDHIVERAPIIDGQTCEEVDPRCSWKAEQPEQDADANFDAPNGETHYDEAEEAAARGSEPTPYAEAIEKGAITQDEADFLVSERERIAADEQAKFFGQGMMADADRHAQDQRGIVERVFDAFKSKEPA